MEGSNPDEIPVEYADVYSDKEESSTDDDKDSHNDISIERNTNENEYGNTPKHDKVEVTIRSATDSNPRQHVSKRKVPSMYDEDMYALPNENEEGSNTTAPNDKILHSKQESIEKESKKRACCNIRCYFLVFGFLLVAAGVGVPIYFTTNKSGNNIQYHITSNQYNIFHKIR